MLHLREKTSGIDCEIQEMQKDIYDALTGAFQFKNVEAYGRLYRNETNDGIRPQWFSSQVADYETVYLDDTKDIILSFIDGETHNTVDGFTYVAPVKIVFWFNLDKIEVNHYPDAEAQRIASVILKENVFNELQFKQLEKGLRNVYSGFNTGDIRFDNMNPYHVFSLNIDLTYQLTKICE